MILEYAFSSVLMYASSRRSYHNTMRGARKRGKKWGSFLKAGKRVTPSPLQESLFVPLLEWIIAHHGPRHLLVLLVDHLLRESRQPRRIVAFKSRALAVQLSNLNQGKRVSYGTGVV